MHTIWEHGSDFDAHLTIILNLRIFVTKERSRHTQNDVTSRGDRATLCDWKLEYPLLEGTDCYRMLGCSSSET